MVMAVKRRIGRNRPVLQACRISGHTVTSGMLNSERHVRRVTVVGLCVNVALSALKFAAGILAMSQTLVADAFHSLSDSVTDIAVIIGSFYWNRPPDEKHQYGHRRVETLVTMSIGIVLAIAGATVGWRAIATMHERHGESPGVFALVAAGISIVVKEVLYRWTLRAGRQVKSTALIANAWHHRLDALSSIPAIIAVGAAIMFPGWAFLDHVGAVVVSTMILHAAYKIIMPAISEVTEAGASPEVLKQIIEIGEATPEVKEIHKVRTRYLGAGLVVDLHMIVDGTMSVHDGHDVSDQLRDRLHDADLGISQAIVHIEPTQAL